MFGGALALYLCLCGLGFDCRFDVNSVVIGLVCMVFSLFVAPILCDCGLDVLLLMLIVGGLCWCCLVMLVIVCL